MTRLRIKNPLSIDANTQEQQAKKALNASSAVFTPTNPLELSGKPDSLILSPATAIAKSQLSIASPAFEPGGSLVQQQQPPVRLSSPLVPEAKPFVPPPTSQLHYKEDELMSSMPDIKGMSVQDQDSDFGEGVKPFIFNGNEVL